MAFQFRELMTNAIPGESIRWELTCGPISVDTGIRREDPDSEPKTPKEKDKKEKDKDKKDKSDDATYYARMADLQQQLRQALQQGR
jgi:hypothetical protein